jgi:hypothetical protein
MWHSVTSTQAGATCLNTLGANLGAFRRTIAHVITLPRTRTSVVDLDIPNGVPLPQRVDN